MNERHSSSSPKKNWSAQRLLQKIRPMLRFPQSLQIHLKQMGHLLSVVSISSFWHSMQFMSPRNVAV